MSEQDRQAVVKALKATASALSFCETDVQLVVRDRLEAIWEAIGELEGDAE